MKFVKIILAVLEMLAGMANALIYSALASSTMLYVGLGIHPIVGAIIGVSLCIGLSMPFVTRGARRAGVAYNITLYKEMFAAEVKEGYQPNGSFLNEVDNDYSAFVENETINWAEVGAEPEVLVNSTVYPREVVFTQESQISVALDNFGTKTFRIGSIEKMMLRYDKMQVITRQIRRAIDKEFIRRAAFNYAPAANTADTPTIGTTGADSGGFKIAKIEDIIKLQYELDNVDAPDNRVLLLHPLHGLHLQSQDVSLYKAYQNLRTGQFLDAFGFKIYKVTVNAKYNKSTGAKVAWGAAAAPSTDTVASVAFCPEEVMKAVGGTMTFINAGDVHYRGDLIGVDQRMLATAIRNKGRVALYSAGS